MTCGGSARQPAAVARRPAARGGAATGRGRQRHGNPQRWAARRPAAGASGYRQRGRRPAAEAVRSRAAGGGAATGSRRRHGDLQQGCRGGDLQRQRASPCSGGTRICGGRDLQPRPRIDLQRQQPPAMTAHQSAASARRRHPTAVAHGSPVLSFSCPCLVKNKEVRISLFYTEEIPQF
ncbi:hypothetical protein BRADI_1g45193v3 [Brachypodium distachyon]|uniref:Uncharacterized protein n=1 Tax=Brachypodium distachyon TaxID=15368 RepID=A0A2K2DPG1_BRADI|nr:hypothetical protein BRADI_1g45193v3 [Brachypodium distachyon]